MASHLAAGSRARLHTEGIHTCGTRPDARAEAIARWRVTPDTVRVLTNCTKTSKGAVFKVAPSARALPSICRLRPTTASRARVPALHGRPRRGLDAVIDELSRSSSPREAAMEGGKGDSRRATAGLSSSGAARWALLAGAAAVLALFYYVSSGGGGGGESYAAASSASGLSVSHVLGKAARKVGPCQKLLNTSLSPSTHFHF